MEFNPVNLIFCLSHKQKEKIDKFGQHYSLKCMFVDEDFGGLLVD